MHKARALLAARVVVALVLMASIAWALSKQWHEFNARSFGAHPDVDWALLLVSGAIFLATYGVLIQTWRVMLAQWGAELPFWRAARIWTISNLYKYVPGKLWTIPAMGAMAQRDGVSPAAAAGSAVLNTVVNIATGAAIALVCGWRIVDVLRPGARPLMLSLTALSLAGLLALPWLMARIAPWLGRVTGRSLGSGAMPPSVIMYAVAGNLVAWLCYGVAFHVLVRAVLGVPAGALQDHIAVYTASYVLGYLAFFLPAGIGVRDASMAVALPLLGMMLVTQAWWVTLASRIWLTILELVPGLLFLATDAIRRVGSR